MRLDMRRRASPTATCTTDPSFTIVEEIDVGSTNNASNEDNREERAHRRASPHRLFVSLKIRSGQHGWLSCVEWNTKTNNRGDRERRKRAIKTSTDIIVKWIDTSLTRVENERKKFVSFACVVPVHLHFSTHLRSLSNELLHGCKLTRRHRCVVLERTFTFQHSTLRKRLAKPIIKH